MDAIRFEHISKKFGSEKVLTNLKLDIPEGKFFALLGPSGCGKTTILRLIAGFEKPDGGRIYLDGRDVTEVPVNERLVNTVFQHYALFPHLNVFDNVAYGLRVKGFHRDIIRKRVIDVLRKMHLEKQAAKSISKLSGGQQQRVALARAIVNEPKVLLLDEPLAALDPKLKEQMLVELIELQYELKTTFVYVTHDQSEALAVADRMAIMNADGEIAQIGTPKEVYEFPISSFVAQFVGKTNLLEGTINCTDRDSLLVVPEIGSFRVAMDLVQSWARDGKEALLSVRPEKIEITKEEEGGFSNHLYGTVDSIIYHGRATEYLVEVGNRVIDVFEQNEQHFARDTIAEGDKVHLYWQKDNAVLLEK